MLDSVDLTFTAMVHFLVTTSFSLLLLASPYVGHELGDEINQIFTDDSPRGLESRITGGTVAHRAEFPWQVYVQSMYDNETLASCSGSLISADYVLTAAQCVEGADTVILYLGANNIEVETEVGRVILESEVFIVHENFNDTFFDNDVALVQLPRPISSSPYISPIRLPSGDHLNTSYVGTLVRVSGWGFTKDDGELSADLRYTDVMVEPNDVCDKHYGSGWISEKKMCTSTRGGRGPCSGDGGAPLVVQDTNGESVQIGIFSFLDTDSCVRGLPVGYISVAAYLDWLPPL